jgi:calcineurin-like phosphoesterase family protein
MGEIFVCSDLHFNHKNIIEYEHRPWPDKEAMNEGLIQRWNAAVSDSDMVYMLGDVGFCGKTKATALVSRLNGYKILILGNHDLGRSNDYWMDVGFNEVHKQLHIQYGGKHIVMAHEPPEYTQAGMFYMYGHVHGDPAFPDWTESSACVCIERLNYAPARLGDVLSGKAYQHREGVALPEWRWRDETK